MEGDDSIGSFAINIAAGSGTAHTLVEYLQLAPSSRRCVFDLSLEQVALRGLIALFRREAIRLSWLYSIGNGTDLVCQL